MKKFTVACVAFAAVFAFAGTAAAEDLGGEGQIAISSDLQLSFTSTSQSLPDSAPEGTPDPDSTTTIVVAPALDYFVAESISIGGQVFYASTSMGDASSSGFGIGPRVGYAIPIGEGLAFWPKLGIAYTSSSYDSGVEGSEKQSGTTMSLEVFAPFAIQPAEHFFVGIGPMLSMDLSNKVEDEDAGKSTTFGVMTQVGGYF